MDACGWNPGYYGGGCFPSYDPCWMPPVCPPIINPAAYYAPCCPPVWTPYPPMYGYGYGYCGGGGLLSSMWGAAAGGTAGALIGCLAGPPGILLGGTIGAIAGALWGACSRWC